MNISKYDIDSLIECFERHSLEADKNTKEWKDQYDKLSPEEQKERAYLNQDFNFPRALLAICREIQDLKG